MGAAEPQPNQTQTQTVSLASLPSVCVLFLLLFSSCFETSDSPLCFFFHRSLSICNLCLPVTPTAYNSPSDDLLFHLSSTSVLVTQLSPKKLRTQQVYIHLARTYNALTTDRIQVSFLHFLYHPSSLFLLFGYLCLPWYDYYYLYKNGNK